MNMHKYSKSFWRAFLVNIVQDCWIVWVIGFGLNTFRSQLKSVISTKIIINYDNDSKLLFAGMSCSSDCHWLPGLICCFLIYSLRFIRAVAYRWIIRWLCGYMGWENTRPLPACVYHDIRTRYQTVHRRSRGYRNAQNLFRNYLLYLYVRQHFTYMTMQYHVMNQVNDT